MSVTTFTTVNGRILRQNKDGVVHNFVSDPLGSVVMVRDTSGNTVYEAEYDPYGNVQSETGTNPSSLGYVGTLGYIRDSATSIYVRARYLLNNLGRWLTKDPLWPNEAGYAYAGAVPNTWADPSGQQIADQWKCRFNRDFERWVWGFFPPPITCGNYPGGPCAFAKEVAKVDNGDFGGVVCCNGKKYACDWNYPPGTFPGIKKCTRVHEYDHFDDVDCGSDFSRPDFRAGKDGRLEECNAVSIHVTCLEKGMRTECSKFTGARKMKCLDDYLYHLCLRCRRLRDTYRCPSNKIPKVCKGCR